MLSYQGAELFEKDWEYGLGGSVSLGVGSDISKASAQPSVSLLTATCKSGYKALSYCSAPAFMVPSPHRDHHGLVP